jgi:hypothetical protein
VQRYDQYLTGDVWGYVIEDSARNELESCWGFYGERYCQIEGDNVMVRLLTRQAAA